MVKNSLKNVSKGIGWLELECNEGAIGNGFVLEEELRDD
jgi:hypothetical protein